MFRDSHLACWIIITSMIVFQTGFVFRFAELRFPFRPRHFCVCGMQLTLQTSHWENSTSHPLNSISGAMQSDLIPSRMVLLQFLLRLTFSQIHLNLRRCPSGNSRCIFFLVLQVRWPCFGLQKDKSWIIEVLQCLPWILDWLVNNPIDGRHEVCARRLKKIMDLVWYIMEVRIQTDRHFVGKKQ